MTDEELDLKARAYNLGERQGRTFPREGGGCFARYERGDVYSHPELGTWPIPDPIRGEWGLYGYEMHWLGYPESEPLGTDDRWQEFEHGWVTILRDSATAFAQWVHPVEYGWATAKAQGYPSGWIVQLTTKGKVARSPEGEITVYAAGELAPPEAEYFSAPRHFPTLAQREEQWQHPPKPEPEPEPEYPGGLDYDPDEIPEY